MLNQFSEGAAKTFFSAKKMDSCDAADVALWPLATNFSLGPDVSFRGEAEVGRAADFAASVDNDPCETSVPPSPTMTNHRPVC
jgi:hypothetical protein